MMLLADSSGLAGALVGLTGTLMALSAILQVRTLAGRVEQLEKKLDERQ